MDVGVHFCHWQCFRRHAWLIAGLGLHPVYLIRSCLLVHCVTVVVLRELSCSCLFDVPKHYVIVSESHAYHSEPFVIRSRDTAADPEGRGANGNG